MGHLWQFVLRRRQNQIRLLEIILHTAIIQLFARAIQEINGTLMINVHIFGNISVVSKRGTSALRKLDICFWKYLCSISGNI